MRQAPADGHTILMGSNSPAVVNAVTVKNPPCDPFKDLRPLFGLAIIPVTFAVRADSPHKTVADVVAAATKGNRPLQLGNYSAGYQLVAAYHRSAQAWFGQPIATGIAGGEIAPHNDPTTTAVILLGTMRGVMLQWLVDPRLPLAAVRDRLLQRVAQALRQA